MIEACGFRPIGADDAAAIARIYNHYVLNTVITFEEESVADDTMAARIRDAAVAGLPWFVAEQAGRILGYANAAQWKGRCAYRYSVETGLYLDPEATGRGIGTRLYEALLGALRLRNVHAAIAGIALPNPASVAMHERCGFEKTGQFREVGFKFGRWIDVGYWQRLFDTSA